MQSYHPWHAIYFALDAGSRIETHVLYLIHASRAERDTIPHGSPCMTSLSAACRACIIPMRHELIGSGSSEHSLLKK